MHGFGYRLLLETQEFCFVWMISELPSSQEEGPADVADCASSTVARGKSRLNP